MTTAAVRVGSALGATRYCAVCAVQTVADRIAAWTAAGGGDDLRLEPVPGAGPDATCAGCGRPLTAGEPRSAPSLLAAALTAARAAPPGTPCPRCGAELPPGRRRYCSQRCAQAAAARRYRARRAGGDG